MYVKVPILKWSPNKHEWHFRWYKVPCVTLQTLNIISKMRTNERKWRMFIELNSTLVMQKGEWNMYCAKPVMAPYYSVVTGQILEVRFCALHALSDSSILCTIYMIWQILYTTHIIWQFNFVHYTHAPDSSILCTTQIILTVRHVCEALSNCLPLPWMPAKNSYFLTHDRYPNRRTLSDYSWKIRHANRTAWYRTFLEQLRYSDENRFLS
jgi:hypothetical protein